MTVTATIEINAPREIVREIFLDFDNLRTWHDGSFFDSIAADKHGTKGADLQPGDYVQVKIPAMAFKPKVLANTPDKFEWLGSIPILLYGPHAFEFISHPDDSTKTTFRQTETFTGLLGPLMGLFGGEKTKAGWDRVNQHLKAESEKVWANNRAGTGV